MSKFFAKLAARTLGTTPTAQPALAPLFASGPVLPGSSLPGIAENDLQEAQPRAEEEGHFASTLPVAMQNTMPHMNTDRPHPQAGQFVTRMIEMLDQSTSASPLPANNSLHTQPTGEPRIPSFTPIVPIVSAFSESERENSVRPLIPPLLREPAPQMRAASPATTSPRRMSQERPQEETVPTVRISIGRIEVRAIHNTPSSAPQARPAPRSPQPSLESYLQARNRGKP